MLGSPAGPGGPTQRGLWPLAPAPSATSFMADEFSKCGVYSLFPAGGPTFGSALYSHARTIGQFTSGHIQQSSASPLYHKDSLFSPTGYTFGAPTPPPGSPYSPVPVTQLELLAKGFNSNIIIQQNDFGAQQSPSLKKSQEKKVCDEKCCNNFNKQKCNSSQTSPIKKSEVSSGCSRTNPIEWNNNVLNNVKKEPGACQVAEISTSVSPVIKLEVTSPKNSTEHHGLLSPTSTTNAGMARQRFHQEVPPAGLLTTVNNAQIKEVGRISSEMVEGMAAAGGAIGGATLLQCTDERTTALAGWPMGGPHNSTIATPTLWQYPAPVPMEPMVPLPVPMPPVGFQLVRDPTTGGLLLLPTTGLEPLQQAVVWPSYHQPPSVLLPPLPPPPLQLLSSASADYLSATSTTLHQHSTRLVAVTTAETSSNNKRKIPMPIPATTLIKIETDATTLDQTKTLHQAVSTMATNAGVYTAEQQPLVTTHLIYHHQHPTNLILSSQPTPPAESSAAICSREQATSPVHCLTPPPEVHDDESTFVQDASNQTETPICSEDDNTSADVEVNDKRCEDAISASITTVPEKFLMQQKVEPEQVPEVMSTQDETTAVKNEDESIKPDISGLQLLSNSIVEFENVQKCKTKDDVLNAIAHMSLKDKETISSTCVEDTNLGGLDLLCALAEQRILEENDQKQKHKEHKKEKRKLKKSGEEPKKKKMRYFEEKAAPCQCPDDITYRHYKTPKNEEEVKKFIASKSQTGCCRGDSPFMNHMELDMRMKLADLQRQYREKQKELSKLKPKKHHHHHHHDCSKTKRKKSTLSERSLTPPPDQTSTPPPLSVKSNQELIKPPTFCASFENGTVTNKPESKAAFKQSDRIINDYKNDLLRQAAAAAVLEETSEGKNSSSSKKRKVGRPKKLLSSSGYLVTTETIVAKKPKNNFVGYLLAAKEKLQNRIYQKSNTPPRYVEDNVYKQNNNNDEDEDVKSCKIRPKLKAEPTVKAYEEEEEEEVEEDEWEDEDVASNYEDEQNADPTPLDDVNDDAEEETNNNVKEHREEVSAKQPTSIESRCTLTSEHLAIDKLRVLTAMGGLFYAGHLNAVQPPDVYSITLDGERGNRPHIMSREEILRDAIVEVQPKSTQELLAGTRLCAYWSQQYRCLYPGSVAEPGTPDPVLDSKFVAVEFDDGDSGRIALEDIRLLPTNYPIIEYDPNPLLSLSKRRRRTSTSISTEERREPPCKKSQTIAEIPDFEVEKENKDINKPDTEAAANNKERKRLKKKKRDKLKQKLLHDDKKRRKKHKCIGDQCKHKKHHKKHRKHKKHHHYDEKKEEKKEERQEETLVEIKQNCILEELAEAAPDIPGNPEDEVTMDDIVESNKAKKIRERQESCESRSKMSAFLPARQLWGWSGKGYKRPRARGRSRKQFYKSIQRGKETITVGDSAVFLSTGRPDRPYIGKIEAMWELCAKMVVKVKWFYHPEETVGCPLNLQYPGALFESPHVDENDVQTISHKCEVLPLGDYTARLGDDPQRYATIYDNNDIYYLAGYYDPTTTTLKMEPEIPFTTTVD